jgi:hypothetical protein
MVLFLGVPVTEHDAGKHGRHENSPYNEDRWVYFHPESLRHNSKANK